MKTNKKITIGRITRLLMHNSRAIVKVKHMRRKPKNKRERERKDEDSSPIM